MADVNRWHRQIERRVLEALRGDVYTLRAAARGINRVDYGQRRMATRVLSLIDAKLLELREQDERAESWSEDDIAKELKA